MFVLSAKRKWLVTFEFQIEIEGEEVMQVIYDIYLVDRTIRQEDFRSRLKTNQPIQDVLSRHLAVFAIE